MKRLLALFAVLCALCAPSLAVADQPDQPDQPQLTEAELYDWVVDRLRAWSPPGRSFIPEAKETVDEGLARYRTIARDSVAVAFDPSEPPLFPGRLGLIRTLSVILAVASLEGGLRRDVDLGLGKLARGDNGKSWCSMQINLGRPRPDGRTGMRIALEGSGFRFTSDPSDWGGEDLAADRKKCFKVGLRRIRMSFNRCRGLDLLDRLSDYASGQCLEGQPESRVRMTRAQKWLREHPAPASDAAVLRLFAPPAPPGAISLLEH